MSLVSKQLEIEERERINGVSVVAHSLFAAVVVSLLPGLYTKMNGYYVITLALAVSSIVAYWFAYRIDKKGGVQGRWGSIAKTWFVMAMILTMYILRGLPEDTASSTTKSLWLVAGCLLLISVVAAIAEASITEKIKPNDQIKGAPD